MRFAMPTLVLCFAPLACAIAQGPLQPPGAPAPTMRTLQQVEPRTPISSLPFTISAPGSYYLTGNLTGVSGQPGITVSSDNVTIDLNGFALIGVAGAEDGIRSGQARTNIAIHNGTIRNWKSGILFPSMANGHFEKLRVSNNSQSGIFTGSGSGSGSVKDCVLEANTGTGLLGSGLTVRGCVARLNGLTGILAVAGSTVTDCVATLNGDGISVSYSTVTGCVASANKGHGIEAGENCLILNNTASDNDTPVNTFGGSGVRVSGKGNRIEGNNSTNNDYGIRVVSTGNIIIKNTCRGSNPYSIADGNSVGQILDVENANANNVINTSNAWANFSY